MKGGLAILLGSKMPKLGKGSSSKDEESSPELPSGSKKDYAQGILDAIKDEDADALAEALEGFQSCCSEEKEE